MYLFSDRVKDVSVEKQNMSLPLKTTPECSTKSKKKNISKTIARFMCFWHSYHKIAAQLILITLMNI